MNPKTKQRIIESVARRIESNDAWTDAIDGLRICGWEVGCDRDYEGFENGKYIASLRRVSGGGWEYDIWDAPASPDKLSIFPVSARG